MVISQLILGYYFALLTCYSFILNSVLSIMNFNYALFWIKN